MFSCGSDLGVLVVARLSVGVTGGGGVSTGGHLLAVGSLLHAVVVVAAVARHLLGQAVRGRRHIWATTQRARRRLVRPRGPGGLGFAARVRVCVLFPRRAFT